MTTQTATGRPGLADELAAFYRSVTSADLPLRVRLWDGSEAGRTDGPVLVFSGPVVARRLLRHPNQLGFANAYIAGEVDVRGDIVEALRRLRPAERVDRGRLLRSIPRGVALLGRLATVRPHRDAAMPTAATMPGRRHSQDRDQAIIGHHYDMSNEFYRLVLGPSMAYSCGYWASDCGYRVSDAPGYPPADGRDGPDRLDGLDRPDRLDGLDGLDAAQQDKIDLICDKLRLRPGSRLLDLGCGWGSLTVRAASAYGARVTAVTLSMRQHEWVTRAVTAAGLDTLVDVRVGHYEAVVEGAYDAIACVEMGEHVGRPRYPAFATRLRRLLRPGGLALVQQMSRHGRDSDGGAFIRTYIAPGMDMRPIGATVAMLEEAGLEVVGVQGLREHYTRTILAWLERLDRYWSEAVRLVGEPTARMFRLYLAGGAVTFEEGRMGVDQILVRGHRGGPR